MDRQNNSHECAIWECPNCADQSDGSNLIGPDDWTCRSCGFALTLANGIPVFAPELIDTTLGYDQSFFEFTASVERSHFWYVPRRRLLTTLIDRYFPDASRYLEIGCGTGDMLSAVLALKSWPSVNGSDLYPKSLSSVASRLGKDVGLVQLDARHIPASAKFDIIAAFDVIEHIVDDEQVLKSMHAALKPGGGVIIAVPQHPFLWSHSDDLGGHVRRYRRGELEDKLQHAGFSIEYSNSYVALLLPLMLVSRLIYKYGRHSRTREPTAVEYKLPWLANAILTKILEAEVTAALAGLPLPVGGSRVVVARHNSQCIRH